jgi:hypothetical protein
MINKLKQQLKELFLTVEGWIGWIIANIVTSLPWAVPLIYGFVLKDSRAYIIAGSVWTFMMLPLTPFWILNVIIAVFVKNVLIKRKRGIINL